MAKVKYCARENKKTGTHSFFAQPVFNGTISMDELCHEAFDGKAVEESTAKAAIEEFMKAVQRNVLKGFRCQIGNDFLTIYPNIELKVKDQMKEGKMVVATAEMLNAGNAKSRLGCTVSPKFSQKFASEVSWQKVDANGMPVDEQDDITQGNENVDGGQPSSGDDEPTSGDGNINGGGGGDGEGADIN